MRRRFSHPANNHANHRLPPLVTAEQWAALAKELCLTPKQTQVAYLVLQAKRDKEIAAAMGLGVSTVRMHLRYVFNQLNVSDRMELAILVFRRLRRDGGETPH